MMLAFVLIAGSLAAGAAVLLLLPLMRQREDTRPAAGLAAGGVLVRAVVRRRRAVCGLQQLFLGRDARRGGYAGGHGGETRASAWRAEPNDLEGWMHARPHLQHARTISARRARLPARRSPRQWPERRCHRRRCRIAARPGLRADSRGRGAPVRPRAADRAQQSQGAALQRVRGAEPRRAVQLRANASSACSR